MFVEEIRRQAEAAPRAALPAIASALWKVFAEGYVTEAEAEALSGLIEARQFKVPAGNVERQEAHACRHPPQDRQRRPRTGAGSRPVSSASIERRRRWAASGRLPPAIAARFSLAEQAALALIAAETARKGDCRLAIEHLAAVAGVSRSTIKNALREARKLGLLTVEERRVTAFRNLPNIVRIVSPEWTAWLRLGRKGVTDRAPLGPKGVGNRRLPQGGGVKSVTGTLTQISTHGKTRTEGLTSRPVAGAKPSSRGTSRVAGA